jgi:hypothetical protein
MKRTDREKLKSGACVRVSWEDISDDSDEGWVKPDKIKNKPAAITTIGYVVKCGRSHVTLAMAWGTDYSGDFEVGTTSAIPFGVITNVEVWP